MNDFHVALFTLTVACIMGLVLGFLAGKDSCGQPDHSTPTQENPHG